MTVSFNLGKQHQCGLREAWVAVHQQDRDIARVQAWGLYEDGEPADPIGLPATRAGACDVQIPADRTRPVKSRI